MSLTSTGLTVQTYEEVLDAIVTSEQENVSSEIEVGDDTSLGETNKIMASQIASVNQVLQDVYDQRDIYEAEGTALDDNISWLGLTRQSATATSGEQYFIGTDGTTISSNSYLKNDNSGYTFTSDAAVTLSKSACRECTVEVVTIPPNGEVPAHIYTVTVGGIDSTYEFVDDDTEVEIIFGLTAAVEASGTGNDYSAEVDPNDSSKLLFTVDDFQDRSISNDDYLTISSVSSAGNITATLTGANSATANSVATILSPTSGWNSTYNPQQLVQGRDEETDAELRVRAINYRSSSGKATIDSIKAAILDISGVSSISINEQFVSDGAGSGTLTIEDNTDDTYAVKINGTTYSYDSTGETSIQIASALALVIDPNGDGYSGNGLKATDNLDATILISSSTLYRIKIEEIDTDLLSAIEGQPGGSMQVVITGGSDNDEIAQEMWDTKPGGVEFWAVDPREEGEADDDYGATHTLYFNRPTSISTFVDITYQVFDTTVYPEVAEDAYTAVKEAIVAFGNDLAAGETVTPGEFEGTVYGAVSGIYDVYIEMTAQSVTAASDDRNGIVITELLYSSDEKADFTTGNITVLEV